MKDTIKYPYLPAGHGIEYVPAENEYMAAAKEFAASFSSDHQMPTGAVIVKDGEIIGRGANQVALTHPALVRLHKDYLCTRRLLHIPSGQKYWLCPGCASPNQHAESRAVRDALAHTSDTHGADLYLWGHWWCCEVCWRAMITAGIRDVYLLEGSEVLFDKNDPGNIIGRQFE
jgi:deoxycytidylate deaminase